MSTNDAKKDVDQLLVEVFMAKMRSDAQAIPTHPTIPSLEIRKLRARLMLEEVLETIQAGLGLKVVMEVKNVDQVKIERNHVTFNDAVEFNFEEGSKPSLVEIADGCADVEVVTKGTASACGIALPPIFKIVSASNLSKFGPGHSFRPDGKLIKSPDFVGPTTQIFDELVAQGLK